VWQWNTLDVFQADEKARSVAFKTYVDAGMLPHVAAFMLGIEIPRPEDVPDHYEDSFEEKEEPEAFGLSGSNGREPGMDKEQLAEYQRERAQTVGETRAIALDKWERMAAKRFDEGHPEKALGFETELIPANLAAGIRKALEGCKTSEDVRSMFGRVNAAQEWLREKGGEPSHN